MDETTGWVESAGGVKLFMRRWKAEGKPRAIFHVVHGMTEHSLRYRPLAEKLCARGIEVWAADMRGHGKTADFAVNRPDSGGLLGHTADKNGFFQVVEDLGFLCRYILDVRRDPGPGIPLFIMGHSWGSFLVQGFIEGLSGYGRGIPLKGCILSGTRGPGGMEIALGAPFLALLACLNPRRISYTAQALSMGANNKPFRLNRTPFDWLSRDEVEVDAYAADPLCGGLCSSGFYRDMIGGLAAVHRKKAVRRIPRELSMYIFCGSADPVGEMGASPVKLVNAYRAHGMEDLEFVIYPGARHEPLNETNREEVIENLLAWLERRIQT
ncbi:MAG: lysophospholipase [Treponema sp.]|nr:lysophospholipase [Treponema sp.]